jgi:hypothetical protein
MSEGGLKFRERVLMRRRRIFVVAAHELVILRENM